jgi:hypothetical protein
MTLRVWPSFAPREDDADLDARPIIEQDAENPKVREAKYVRSSGGYCRVQPGFIVLDR